MSDLAEQFKGSDPKPVYEGGIGRSKPKARKTHTTQWAKLHREKGGPCRLCGKLPYELHHLLSRARGGADEAWNLVPLDRGCHDLVTNEDSATLRALAAALTDDEYAGLIEAAGEGAMERLFQARYER